MWHTCASLDSPPTTTVSLSRNIRQLGFAWKVMNVRELGASSLASNVKVWYRECIHAQLLGPSKKLPQNGSRLGKFFAKRLAQRPPLRGWSWNWQHLGLRCQDNNKYDEYAHLHINGIFNASRFNAVYVNPSVNSHSIPIKNQYKTFVELDFCKSTDFLRFVRIWLRCSLCRDWHHTQKLVALLLLTTARAEKAREVLLRRDKREGVVRNLPN